MASENLHTVETKELALPEQRLRPIGAAAIVGETYTEQTAEFQMKTPEQLLNLVTEETTIHGYNLDKLEYQDQPGFAHCVHSIINKHFAAQHRYEWDSNKENAIAPPLPYQWVKARIDTYYAGIYKGDGDKAHENTILSLRKRHLPEALAMADALPEIEAAIEIQALLDDAGKEMAADAVGDLLVVYGVTIHFLKEKQAQIRKERQEKAERAAAHLGQMLQ